MNDGAIGCFTKHDFGEPTRLAGLSKALERVREPDMTDRSDLIQRADDLRKHAEHEADESVRARLIRMADYYVHLAESNASAEAHPVTVASISDVFIEDD
jgi:hypothetical protein